MFPKYITSCPIRVSRHDAVKWGFWSQTDLSSNPCCLVCPVTSDTLLCPFALNFLICKMGITILLIVKIKLENLPKACRTKWGPLQVVHVNPCPQCHCLCCALCLKRPPPRPLLAPVAPVCSFRKRRAFSGRPLSHSPPQPSALVQGTLGTPYTPGHNSSAHFPVRFPSLPISHGGQTAKASLVLPWLISLPPSFLPSPRQPWTHITCHLYIR